MTRRGREIWNGLRPEKWRRLHFDRPVHTILAQMHRDLSEWVHPGLERWITVREAARLQSFHDGFIFVGSEWQQLKQIGNVQDISRDLLGQPTNQLRTLVPTKPFQSSSIQCSLNQERNLSPECLTAVFSP
jgi:DNA (cytosine-5)-methyltransferase 1